MSEREIATLENRLANTEPFDYDYHNRVGKVNGLYSFWLNGCCLYIGISDNIGRRLWNHRTNATNTRLDEYMFAFGDKIEASYVELEEMSRHELELLEDKLIKSMKTKTNVQHAD